jgi:hypothetical protein
VRLRAYVLVVGLSGLAMLRSVHAADTPVDDGLLEFLGSVDSDDKNWRQYLAATETDPAAKRAAPAKPAAPAPPAAPPPSATPAPGSTARPGVPAVSPP